MPSRTPSTPDPGANDNARPNLTITVGGPAWENQGRSVELDPKKGPGDALAEILDSLPAGQLEGWASPHSWTGDSRAKESAWKCSSGVWVDLDCEIVDEHGGKKKVDVPEELRAAAEAGFGSSLRYPTPHGWRVCFVFDRPELNFRRWRRAADGAIERVRLALEVLNLPSPGVGRAGLEVDLACFDDKRVFYHPRAFVKDVQREAMCVVESREPFTVDQLIASARPEAQPDPRPEMPLEHRVSSNGSVDVQLAVDRFNRDHPQDWPKSPSEDYPCPSCGHRGCFGQLPDSNGRWKCFSVGHPRECGIPSEGGGASGDVLDLVLWQQRRIGGSTARVAFLKEMGFLADHRVTPTTHSPAQSETSPPVRGWPSRLAPEAFAGLVGRFIDVVGPCSEADAAALLGQYLVAFGNAMHRAPHTVAEADRHGGNLFLILVGETAKARKGSSWGRVRALFKLVDEPWVTERVLSGLSSGEGLIWQVRDPIYKRDKKGNEVLDDPGVSDKRLLVYEGEFAATLRVCDRDGNTLSGTVRNAWDLGILGSLTKNSPAKATDVHVSIIGHVTRDELVRYLDRTEAANGFANRFLWFCVRRSKAIPEPIAVDQQAFNEIADLTREALDFARRKNELHRDDAARALWAQRYLDLSTGRPGLLSAMIARAEAQVTRLSTVYALLDRSEVIREAHLRSALAVWDYSQRSTEYIFGDSLGDPIADVILAALRANPQGLTRTEISGLFGGHRERSRIGAALAQLQLKQLAAFRHSATDGRSAEVWYATKAGEASK